jgi:hypothetical protein
MDLADDPNPTFKLTMGRDKAYLTHADKLVVNVTARQAKATGHTHQMVLAKVLEELTLLVEEINIQPGVPILKPTAIDIRNSVLAKLAKAKADAEAKAEADEI